MKKLMIAAAAAAMIGSAFAVCVSGKDDCGKCGGAGANVWDVKFTAKTTVLKTVKAKDCQIGSNAYRKQGTAKITGWLWNVDDCSGECYDPLSQFGAGGGPRMALSWNNKYGFVATPSIFVAQIDAKGNKLESWGGMNDGGAIDIKFAGFGSYDLKKNYIKSLSGSFAGTLENEMLCNLAYAIYDCNAYVYVAGTPTAAYGSWSIKHNSSASKKVAKAVAGLGITQGEDEEDDDVEIESAEDLDPAVASVLKFSKYGIDIDNDITDVEILPEDDWAGSSDDFNPEDYED